MHLAHCDVAGRTTSDWQTWSSRPMKTRATAELNFSRAPFPSSLFSLRSAAKHPQTAVLGRGTDLMLLWTWTLPIIVSAEPRRPLGRQIAGVEGPRRRH